MTNTRDVIALELWRCKDKADDKGNKLTSGQFADAILTTLDAAGLKIAEMSEEELKKCQSQT
jgi:hypothetical protein